jgi:hypothetical protein
MTWRYDELYEVVVDENGLVLADMFGTESEKEERGMLMAAAQDLIDAARNAYELLSSYDQTDEEEEARAMLRDAIAKATERKP